MILTCPECSTRYQASDAAFQPSGRVVRCAKCGHSWHQEPPEAEAEEAFAASPARAPQPEPVETETESEVELEAPAAEAMPAEAVPAAEAAPARPRRVIDRLAVAGGWLALVAIVLVIGWAAVNYRLQIATMWPQSASLYSALGLPVNSRGLAFLDVNYKREIEDKQTVLAITGKLVNVSGRELAVPPIRVTLSAADGHELYHWDFTPDAAVLHAGQSLNFSTRLSSPPNNARHLTLKFADSKG